MPMPEIREPLSAAKPVSVRTAESRSGPYPAPRTRWQRVMFRWGLWPQLRNPLSFRSSLTVAFLLFALMPTLVFGPWLDRTLQNASVENGRGRVWLLVASLVLVAVALALASWLSARWAGPLDALPRRLRSLHTGEGVDSVLTQDRLAPDELRDIHDSLLTVRRRIVRDLADVDATHQQMDQTTSDLVRVRQSVENQVLERTQELTEKLRRAEKSERSKGMFLAQLSHEIRTPLNGVLGMLQLLEKSPLNAEQRDWLDTLRSSAGTLLNVLNDSLDYSKIESGKMRLLSEEFELREVLQRVAKLFAPLAEEKKLMLEVRLDPQLPERVKGDADRLAQVVSNLVSNAIKFTHKGMIQVSVQLTSRDVSLVGVRIEVDDTGIGMDSETQERLFQAYYQAESQSQRRFSGGTGLGLAISRQLIQLMGGQIGVRSRPDQGTQIAMDLVFPTVEARPGSSAGGGTVPQAPKPIRALRLLVVDDDPTSQKFIRILLARAGYEVKTVDTAEAMLSDWILGTRFDAVLLDLQLPKMSGLELASRLRELEAASVVTSASARSGTARPGARTHLIALTASALEEDRRQAMQAGFDQFLAKPLRVSELERALEQVGTLG